MDITNTPARPELTVPQAPTEARLKPGDVTGRPETANPVTAAEQSRASTAANAQPIKPLDVFQVGDNDDLPVPPDPPRQSLAMVPLDLPEPANVPSEEAEPTSEAPTAMDETGTEPNSPDTSRPEESPYTSGAPNPSSPTVDIRR
ncbi:hypothetical protein [Gymnodinialimonas hymeniacidonis]|uniref:hypothetical protein n=1 Tax=Gymnodinialimonas hymeniacidonis TaxID=3126508 RepID=UPI0034C65E8A